MNNSEEENQESVSQQNEIRCVNSGIEVQQASENSILQTKFNKKSQLSNEEKLIILLKRSNRTLNELISIEHLTQDLKFFEQINKDQANQKAHLHRKICKYLNFDFRQKGKVVFYQGDIADSFFIVLQGKCLVLINDKDSNQHATQQANSQRMSFLSNGQNFSSALNQLFIDSRKHSSSPGAQSQSKKRLSLLMKGQSSLNMLSTLKILKWRLFHKIVWLVIYANRYIRYSQKKTLEVKDSNHPFLDKLFKFIGPKSFMNERIQRLRKEIQQSIHQDIDLQYLENAPHFFDKQNNLGFMYKAIKIYEKGESFGELGLLSRKPRSATVICLTDCIFASLYKKHYSKTLKEVEQQQINKRIEFIFQTFLPHNKMYNNSQTEINSEDQEDQNHLTSSSKPAGIDKSLISFSESKLNQIQLYFTKVKYQSGKILQKQGEPIERLYIIKKGDVSCYMESIDEKNPSNNLKINLCLLGKYEIIGDEIILQGLTNKKQNQLNKANENENDNKEEDQSNPQANQGNLNGEVKICYYSAVVKSYNCSMLVITKQDFKRMLNDFPEIRKYLKMKTSTKIQWMEQRKKKQIQITKKIHLNQQRIPLNNEQQQIIKENPHILRKKQFKNKKWKSYDSEMIRRPTPQQESSNLEYQKIQNSNHQIQNSNTNSPVKISKQSPQKLQQKSNISRNESYQNDLNNIMISYFQKDLLSSDTINKQKIEDFKKDQVLQDALAIKYGYNPQSLSNKKLKPSQIIDFIFNHQENEQEQQHQQIHQMSERNELLVDPKTYLNYSLDRKKNIQKDSKHLKVDYTTLGYSDTLLQNIKRRQSHINLQDKSEPNQMTKRQTEQINSNNINQSNNVEKQKKKLHISHDADELKMINKINRQILKTTQEIQRTKAFYNQSQEIFINNLACSSKSSTVSPLRYKYMFNSKIQKKQEFEKLFNKTIHSPKQKNLSRQISMQSVRDSNFSRQKSSIHSNISTESLSPNHKQCTPVNNIPQKQSKLIKSPSLNIFNCQLSNSKFDSPYDFSSCIKQTSFGQQKKQSNSIQIENTSQIKQLDSQNLTDSNQIGDKNTIKDMQKVQNLLTPPNASRQSLQKLSRIVHPSSISSSKMHLELSKQKSSQEVSQQSQQISTFLSQTLHSQQSELVQDQQKQLPKNNSQNQNVSLFRQASQEKQKQLSDILTKFYQPSSQTTSDYSNLTINSAKNKELNIHIKQKNDSQQHRTQSGVQQLKHFPFQRYVQDNQTKKIQNFSLDQNAFTGLLIKSQQIQTETEKQLQNKQKEMNRLKKSVFSMQAVQSNKLESPQTKKETPIQSSEKIVILNHMGKPVNYYISHHQQQTSLANLDMLSPKYNKSMPFSQTNIQQKQSNDKISSQNDVYTSSQISTTLLSPKMPQSLQFDLTSQQNIPANNISRQKSSSHFNFNPINTSIKSK
ncbi:cyclic nucleotide-binding domain protein (macronuclear) [Tetrahymena thermophila SB210]|uniref:Cyclic nucleotide-binding domain protein n=1 Tax=Tetrahymena thermophila (strain SB210) TaxID=312017 RepID=Q23H28_TETTS|nr:cyclic nucleotide-binding domain protein [Tetrahymena thermophila SB210]EAR95819.2 cyclic nucleotide-binding domain protein [Tetrahymena thermophila SB210]|eukprot:XP_001016064.2 cyclic nucleotide-binding domain protein [Tetrahymena thermophila SB210]